MPQQTELSNLLYEPEFIDLLSDLGEKQEELERTTGDLYVATRAALLDAEWNDDDFLKEQVEWLINFSKDDEGGFDGFDVSEQANELYAKRAENTQATEIAKAALMRWASDEKLHPFEQFGIHRAVDMGRVASYTLALSSIASSVRNLTDLDVATREHANEMYMYQNSAFVYLGILGYGGITVLPDQRIQIPTVAGTVHGAWLLSGGEDVQRFDNQIVSGHDADTPPQFISPRTLLDTTRSGRTLQNKQTWFIGDIPEGPLHVNPGDSPGNTAFFANRLDILRQISHTVLNS